MKGTLKNAWSKPNLPYLISLILRKLILLKNIYFTNKHGDSLMPTYKTNTTQENYALLFLLSWETQGNCPLLSSCFSLLSSHLSGALQRWSLFGTPLWHLWVPLLDVTPYRLVSAALYGLLRLQAVGLVGPFPRLVPAVWNFLCPGNWGPSIGLDVWPIPFPCSPAKCFAVPVTAMVVTGRSALVTCFHLTICVGMTQLHPQLAVHQPRGNLKTDECRAL